MTPHDATFLHVTVKEMNKYIYHLCCAQQFELTTNSPKDSMHSAQVIVSVCSYTGHIMDTVLC